MYSEYGMAIEVVNKIQKLKSENHIILTSAINYVHKEPILQLACEKLFIYFIEKRLGDFFSRGSPSKSSEYMFLDQLP